MQTTQRRHRIGLIVLLEGSEEKDIIPRYYYSELRSEIKHKMHELRRDTIKYEIPSLASLTDKDHELISSLQGVHDNDSSWRFRGRFIDGLKEVASNYGLSSDILN
jgi:hypothetical protein